MKYLFFFIGCQMGLAQDTLIDYFSDGNFTQELQWKGDTSAFIVNNKLQLQLFASPSSSPQQLYTSSTKIEGGSWSFYNKMLFNPSSQNYTEVILINPDTNFSSSNKLSLELGKNQDKITVKAYDDGNSEILIESDISVFNHSINTIWCKIFQEQSIWTLTYSIDSLQWVTLPSFFYPSQPTATFGIKCHYSSTRKDKFFFDDFKISGLPYKDSIPPLIIRDQLSDSLTYVLEFSEPIDTSSLYLNASIYINQNSNALASANIISPQTIELHFNHIQYNTNFNLHIKDITDLYGNTMSDTVFTFYIQKIYPYDIEIYEFMADPSPPVYLPEIEYIEIKNRSEYPINLYQCQLQIGKNKIPLPKYNLNPNQLVVLYPNSAKSIIDSTISTIFLNSSISLPNSSGIIELLDSNNLQLHALKYKDTWYKNDNKINGGWSLEQLSNFPCIQESAWAASEDYRGGSPGEEHNESIIIDSPKIYKPNGYALTDSTLQLTFSFSILNRSFTNNVYFECNLGIDSIKRVDAFTLELFFTETMVKNKLYKLQLSDQLQPCFPLIWEDLYFGRPSLPLPNLIKISEVCFDTDNEHSEFIEFKNTSNLLLDVYDLVLGVIKDSNFTIAPCSENHILWPKNSFLVLARHLDKLKHYYPLNPEAIYIELEDWITLDDENGEIKLLNRSLQTLDTGCYASYWHTTFLNETQNISLERIDLHSNPCYSESWISASKDVDFASPGFINSQSLSTEISNHFMASFSPNNDGIDDLWEYIINFNLPENVLDILVYDLNGYKRYIHSNGLITGISYMIIWDGKDSDGHLLPVGTYIIVIRNRSDQSLKKIAISITN